MFHPFLFFFPPYFHIKMAQLPRFQRFFLANTEAGSPKPCRSWASAALRGPSIGCAAAVRASLGSAWCGNHWIGFGGRIYRKPWFYHGFTMGFTMYRNMVVSDIQIQITHTHTHITHSAPCTDEWPKHMWKPSHNTSSISYNFPEMWRTSPI